MTNTPTAWYQLRSKVQQATAAMSSDQLALRVSTLQLRWRQYRRSATWDVLQELYTEQHRRRWA